MAERVPAGLVGGLNSIGSCVIVFFYFEFAASTLAVSLGRAGSALIRPGQVTPASPAALSAVATAHAQLALPATLTLTATLP